MDDTLDAELPDLQAMEDTLTFMWLRFLDQLDAARRADVPSDLETRWNGADVVMRMRDYRQDDGAAHRFIDLKIDAPALGFSLNGRYSTDPAFNAGGVDWETTGDHASLCEWMWPWVALHIEQGGGYIDFDG